MLVSSGISSWHSRVFTPPSSERAVYATNVTGVVNTIFPALEGMRLRGTGQIALMSSISALIPLRGVSASYSSSKSAVLHLGEGLRLLLAHEGVRVSVIVPGYVESPMTAALGSKPRMNEVTMPVAVSIIMAGLAIDEPLVIFPFMSAFGLFFGSNMPRVLRHWVARAPFDIWPSYFNYVRPKKATSQPEGPATPSTPNEKPPQFQLVTVQSCTSSLSEVATSTAAPSSATRDSLEDLEGRAVQVQVDCA